MDHCLASLVVPSPPVDGDSGLIWKVTDGGFGSVTSGNLAVETELILHKEAFMSCCGAKPMFMSMAPDKSRVGSYGIQNLPVVLETGVAIAAAPVVPYKKRIFRCNLPDLGFSVPGGNKPYWVLLRPDFPI